MIDTVTKSVTLDHFAVCLNLIFRLLFGSLKVKALFSH